MSNQHHSYRVECLDCGLRTRFHPLDLACPNCGSEWRTARYDLELAAEVFRTQLRERNFDLWRYAELLPLSGRPAFSMGEGGTPLFPAHNLGMMIGIPNLLIKDERQGPTASFKDRQAALTIAALKEAEITEAVVASTGNVAIAFSAYCARAGIKLWAFLTSLVPPAKMHEVALYGTQVVKLTSTYDQAKQLAGDFAKSRGLYLDRGGRSITAIEAMKTVAFEMAEQLGRAEDFAGSETPTGFAAPDWYVQAVSGGLGPLGVMKGFAELREMGLIDRGPAIACIQSAGCSPMVEAWKRGDAQATPVESPSTYISTLSTGDPGRHYELLRAGMLGGAGGAMESVTDEEAFKAMHLAAKMEGLSIEPATAVAFAGLIKLARQGVIRPDQVVVVNCTGHTMPIEEELLGEDWAQALVVPEAAFPERPREGLLAALQVDQRRVQDILIVDDNEDSRRLIRRILQAQGRFEVREVQNGPAALTEARRKRPDLVILDLMMPEMDGFTVLDHLRTQPETANTPVIVITAKELTQHEIRRLEGQIARLMTKGEFLGEDLIGEIGKALR